MILKLTSFFGLGFRHALFISNMKESERDRALNSKHHESTDMHIIENNQTQHESTHKMKLQQNIKLELFTRLLLFFFT